MSHTLLPACSSVAIPALVTSLQGSCYSSLAATVPAAGLGAVTGWHPHAAVMQITDGARNSCLQCVPAEVQMQVQASPQEQGFLETPTPLAAMVAVAAESFSRYLHPHPISK